MYAGVLRDEERQAAKKTEREARERDFEEQARRRAFLESKQSVSNASEFSRPQLSPQQKAAPMDEVEFQGCKTC